MDLKFHFEKGFLKLRLGQRQVEIPTNQLTAGRIIQAVKELTADQAVNRIALDLDAAPASKARIIQVVISLLAKRWGISSV